MGTPQNTAAIYIRQSRMAQEGDALSTSLNAQERDCRAWAEREW